MKHIPSLEEEKRRLLAQIESSRAVYRRMLTESDKDPPSRSQLAPRGRQPALRPGKFPQSQTLRWIAAHPYLTAAAVTALVVVGPRRIMRTVKDRLPSRKPAASQKANANRKADAKTTIAATGLATTLSTTLATAVTMLMRNPAVMNAAMRAVSSGLSAMRGRRGRGSRQQNDARFD